MRKLLLIGTLCFSVTVAFAQQSQEGTGDQLLSKQGQPILPEAGHYGIGFDAVPFLNYFGNIFSSAGNNTVGAGFPGGSQQVFGKYFLSDNMAIRVRGRLSQNIDTDRNRVILDNQTIPDPDIEVTDEWVNNSTSARIGGGVEFRKGTGRIVGVFGGEASFLYGRNSTEYDYGNPITEGNQTPSSTFGGLNGGRFERIVEVKNNKQLGFGVNGFAGVEYFVAPRISLGAEFIIGVDYIKDYREQQTIEFWDNASSSVQTRRSVSEGGKSISLITDNYGGSINLMFYF